MGLFFSGQPFFRFCRPFFQLSHAVSGVGFFPVFGNFPNFVFSGAVIFVGTYNQFLQGKIGHDFFYRV
jgi:hypothetical protein